MEPWIWATILMALGFGLAVLEVFFASAGILGFLSASAIVAAIIMGFQQGPGVGVLLVGVAVFGVPAVVVVGFRVWPHTAIGRRVLLGVPKSDDVLPNSQRRHRLKQLVGLYGKAKSKMLPAGAILIEGRTIDAVSEGVPIEAGETVKVIEVRGNRVVVRAAEEPVPGAESPMDRPIDDISADPFDSTSSPQ